MIKELSTWIKAYIRKGKEAEKLLKHKEPSQLSQLDPTK